MLAPVDWEAITYRLIESSGRNKIKKLSEREIFFGIHNYQLRCIAPELMILSETAFAFLGSNDISIRDRNQITTPVEIKYRSIANPEVVDSRSFELQDYTVFMDSDDVSSRVDPISSITNAMFPLIPVYSPQGEYIKNARPLHPKMMAALPQLIENGCIITAVTLPGKRLSII
jgi:hypothetical protein